MVLSQCELNLTAKEWSVQGTAVFMLTQAQPWRSTVFDWRQHTEFPGKQAGNSSSSCHKGVRWRLPWGCHYADTAQPTGSGLSEHCLPVLFLSSFSSLAMKKGNLMRSGAARSWIIHHSQVLGSKTFIEPQNHFGWKRPLRSVQGKEQPVPAWFVLAWEREKCLGWSSSQGGQRGQSLSHTHKEASQHPEARI